jgi:hypothetical protein
VWLVKCNIGEEHVWGYTFLLAVYMSKVSVWVNDVSYSALEFFCFWERVNIERWKTLTRGEGIWAKDLES